MPNYGLQTPGRFPAKPARDRSVPVVVPYDHAHAQPQQVVHAPLLSSWTAQLARAQPLRTDAPDLRYEAVDPIVAQQILAYTPIVHRTEVIGTEDAGGWVYHTRPESSRNLGGTTAGGVWHMPAPFDARDYRDGAPPALSYASTYRGCAEGVFWAAGYPSNSDGVQDGGFRWGHDGVNLAFSSKSTGTWTDEFSIKAGGVVIHRALEHVGSTLGLFGASATTQPTVSGARDNSEGALADLLTKLALLGAIVDNTTAS